MTTKDKIVRYLKSRSTPATAKEIATYAKLNANTVRKILGEISDSLTHWTDVKCKIDKQYRQGYSLG